MAFIPRDSASLLRQQVYREGPRNRKFQPLGRQSRRHRAPAGAGHAATGHAATGHAATGWGGRPANCRRVLPRGGGLPRGAGPRHRQRHPGAARCLAGAGR
ncbi:MAG: hypothetical protein EHM68_14125, partial [Lysobacterales bacterium]